MIFNLILLSLNLTNFSFDKKIYYQISDLTLNFYNNTFSGKDYNYYNGKYLDKKNKENLLQLIPKEGLKLAGEASLSFLSFTYYFWNLKTSFDLKIKGKVEKELFELILFGNQLNRFYQLKETKGELYTFSQIKNNFSFPFKKNWQIDLGINYLEGYYYFKSENNYLNLLTTSTFLNFYNEINYQKSSGGRGFGLDIGFGKIINEKLNFKFTIENLINKIFWQRENRVGKIILIFDSLNLNKIVAHNYYSFTKEEKETTQFSNRPLPIKINLSFENKIKDYWQINPCISWRIKEFFKFFSLSSYRLFNFLWIINSLNLYFPLDKDIFLESFSYEIGFGLGATIKRFDFLIFQEYYKGMLNNAKGFSFKLCFGYSFLR